MKKIIQHEVVGVKFFGHTFKATVLELNYLFGEAKIKDVGGKLQYEWSLTDKEAGDKDARFRVYNSGDYKKVGISKLVKWKIEAVTKEESEFNLDMIEEALGNER